MSREIGLRYDTIEGSRICILKTAPTNTEFTEYDRCQMITYARLLDAERYGAKHYETPDQILDIPDTCNPEIALVCWQTHLARAKWIIGDGLGKIVTEESAPTEYADYVPVFQEARRRWPALPGEGRW